MISSTWNKSWNLVSFKKQRHFVFKLMKISRKRYEGNLNKVITVKTLKSNQRKYSNKRQTYRQTDTRIHYGVFPYLSLELKGSNLPPLVRETRMLPQHQQDTCRDRIFKLSLINASAIFRFHEFTKFSESSALYRKNCNKYSKTSWSILTISRDLHY